MQDSINSHLLFKKKQLHPQKLFKCTMFVVRRPVLSKDSIAIIEHDKSITFIPDTSGAWQTLQSRIFNHPDGSSNNYAYAPSRIPTIFESSQTFEFLGFQPAIAARMWQTYNQVDASSSEDKKRYERDCYSIAGVRLPFVQSRMIPIIASGLFSSLFNEHVVGAPSNPPDNNNKNQDQNTNDNNSDKNLPPSSPSSPSSSIKTLLTSDKIGLLPSALTAMYCIGIEFEGRLPTPATLVQISNWIGELISRRFFYLEEIDYKIKRYHGGKTNQGVVATSWGPSRRGGDGDWGISRYEALRVNRALERRIVITRWIFRESEENENEYDDGDDDDDDDGGWRNDSEGDNVGRERGDWKECNGNAKS